MRTSEFISPKHPDKLCDIISDTIFDKYLEQDPYTQCNIQVSGGFGVLNIIGEVASDGYLSDSEIIEIVYNISNIENVNIVLKNINKIPHINKFGISIGYATKETETYLPFEYHYTRELNKFIYAQFPFEGKTQITINGDWVDVVASFENTTTLELETIIKEYFDTTNFHLNKLYCNSNGDWSNGGLINGVGASGKQNVIDNYGPRIPLGGGSYSGKDATKLDRCAGYMARRIAVDSLKQYGLQYALVELSYSNNQTQPIQARIKGNDSGINVETGLRLYEVQGYDLSPNGIIDFLDLRNISYAETSKWGHMGNNFNWK
jgi:S-adenosylmethionine synthetase